MADEGFDEAAEETQEVEALDQADDGVVDPDVAILFDVEIEKRGDRIRYADNIRDQYCLCLLNMPFQICTNKRVGQSQGRDTEAKNDKH